MAVYEFKCETCGWVFDRLIPRTRSAGDLVCPACGSTQVRNQTAWRLSHAHGGSAFPFEDTACGAGRR